MVWLALAFVPAVAVACSAFMLLRGGKIHLSLSCGFLSFSFPTPNGELTPVPPARYKRILQRFVQGDLFDLLWIAYHPKDGQGGLVLGHDKDEIEMDVTFLSLKEPDRLAEFRQGMKTWGYIPAAEDCCNVGLGNDFESVTLEYRFAKDLDQVREATERALCALEGAMGDEVFVHLWSSRDIPSGIGIKVVPSRDVLARIP